MHVGILTREYPRGIRRRRESMSNSSCASYAKLIDVDVSCFGAPREEPNVYAFTTPEGLRGANAALRDAGG